MLCINTIKMIDNIYPYLYLENLPGLDKRLIENASFLLKNSIKNKNLETANALQKEIEKIVLNQRKTQLKSINTSIFLEKYYEAITFKSATISDIDLQKYTDKENENILNGKLGGNDSLLNIMYSYAHEFENKLPKKVFYHGVRKYTPPFIMKGTGSGVKIPFGEFNPPKFPATYFTDDLSYARFYAGSAKNQPKPDENYQGFIYSVSLKMYNPLDLTNEMPFLSNFNLFRDVIYLNSGVWLKTPKGIDLNKKYPYWSFVRLNIDNLIDRLKESGFDGIIQIGDVPKYKEDGIPFEKRENWQRGLEYLVFYPEQVKVVLRENRIKLFNDNNDTGIENVGIKDVRFYKKGGYVSS